MSFFIVFLVIIIFIYILRSLHADHDVYDDLPSLHSIIYSYTSSLEERLSDIKPNFTFFYLALQ